MEPVLRFKVPCGDACTPGELLEDSGGEIPRLIEAKKAARCCRTVAGSDASSLSGRFLLLDRSMLDRPSVDATRIVASGRDKSRMGDVAKDEPAVTRISLAQLTVHDGISGRAQASRMRGSNVPRSQRLRRQ